MLLEPLDDGDCRTLIANLLGRGPLPADAETRIAEAADGNALFAEELLAMLVDDDLLAWDGARWVAAEGLRAVPVPTTLHTLLAARLEGLPSDERALLVLASVEGEHLPSQRHPRARPRGAGDLHRAQPCGARAPRRDPARPRRASRMTRRTGSGIS